MVVPPAVAVTPDRVPWPMLRMVTVTVPALARIENVVAVAVGASVTDRHRLDAVVVGPVEALDHAGVGGRFHGGSDRPAPRPRLAKAWPKRL